MRCQRYYEAFRYISENVKEYKNPESLALWRKECKNEMPDMRELSDFKRAIDRRLNRIASTLVREAKCTIKLDLAKRISYFRSEDGSVILSSDHKEEENFFKGTLLTAKRQRSLLFDPTNKSKEIRPSQPTDPEPTNDTNDNSDNPDSKESDAKDESVRNVSDSQDSEHSRIQNGPINGRVNDVERDEQEIDDVAVLKNERSFDRKPEKRPQNSWSSESAKRVKIEEWDEDFVAAPDVPRAQHSEESTMMDEDLLADATPKVLNNPEEPKIRVLLLANNIEITALYCDLEDVQKKASQAIEMIKMEEKEMTLNVADFNSFIDSMLKSIKRSKNRYSRQTEKFSPLKTVYRHIKLSLILPFGQEVTGEALKIVEKEIEELGESQEEVPLETIRGNLDYLLNSGFWI
ncbi:hypothetical protein L3Y34_009510 [Caenorhabditis briggsae]|uniref:SPK domain-containing protein n=1 Tax=Caenorhabditis briggsae TaxID=6238 RepID=A0AAE9A5I1_CAEBR|nr:hypothetical protein L3Y34_009510 [Caenorhabditis briggsae]